MTAFPSWTRTTQCCASNPYTPWPTVPASSIFKRSNASAFPMKPSSPVGSFMPPSKPMKPTPNPLAVELTSPTLGLTGKVDCLRRRDGSYLPYEHKRGQPAADARTAPPPPGPPTAFRSSPTPSFSKKPSVNPFPKAVSAITPPTSPSASPSTTRPAPTFKPPSPTPAASANRRTAANRRQRTPLRPLFPRSRLSARRGPSGSGTRTRPRPALPARPRRYDPPRRFPGRPGWLLRRQPRRSARATSPKPNTPSAASIPSCSTASPN